MCLFIPVFFHMQRHIYNNCLGAYPPTDKYDNAEPFDCSAFGLNTKPEQIHWKILNMEMNMWESTISLRILNILSQYTAAKGIEWVWIIFYYVYYIAITCTSTIDHLIDCRNRSRGGRVYEALLLQFDSVC